MSKFKNKKYLLINKWDNLDKSYYKTVISDVLRVRSMENYCAVVLLSNDFSKCYQTGKNRISQIVKKNHVYKLALNRMGGSEVIWKNKKDVMRKSWRKGFEKLIEYISN